MGSTESKALSINTNEQVVINETNVTTLNEQINETIAKSTMSSSSSCGGNTTQDMKFIIKGCDSPSSGGKKVLNVIGNRMEQTADVNFQCINVANVESQMAQDMLSSLSAEIKSNMDAKAKNKMVADAESSSKRSSFSFPSSSKASSASINKFKTTAVNVTNQHIENVIGNSIDVAFDVDLVSECTPKLSQKQEFEVDTCGYDEANINDTAMIQATKSVSECLNKNEVAQKIVNKMAADLGVKVVAETKAKSESDMEAKSTAKAVIEMCGGSFGNPSASFVTIGIIFLICCGVILAIFALGGMENKETGSSSGTPETIPMDDATDV